jgi:hypothetical protein
MRSIAQIKSSEKPDLSLIRPVLFWDTDVEKINWQRSRTSVLKRVQERGNEIEKKELQRFYNIQP